MSPARRLFRLVSRAFCIGLLAMPLAAAPADAAVKHRKAAAKASHAAVKKHKTAAGKHGKPGKAIRAKSHAKKPPVPKKHAVRVLRTMAKAGPASAQRAISAKPWSGPAAATTASAIRSPTVPTAVPMAVPTAETQDEAPRRAARMCRRQGKIFLLADCDAPLPPALLAAAPVAPGIR